MNILQIGTVDNKGGAASVSWIIKKKLEEKGHRMPMFVSEKKSNSTDVFSIPRRLHRYIHFLFSNDLDLSSTDWIIKTKEFKEADIIHLHNIHGWYFNIKTLQKMSKLKPVVWTLHDMWAITPHCAYSYDCELKNGFFQCPSMKSYPQIFWHAEKYLAWRKKNIYAKSNFSLITPSLWLKNMVEKSILKYKKNDLIYNGVDENIFKISDKTSSRKQLEIPLNKKIILFLSDGGKNNPAKGWLYVESVVKKFNDDGILFICIGGKENGKDETYNNLLYVSRISNKEILSKYFSASDVFLFPSLADNCPLVILEAMACGLPIVTFNTGGIPELVEHLENGYVAKYKDSEDLIRGINYVLNLEKDQILQITTKSRKKIEGNFTIDIMVSQYETLYRKIIQNFKNV
jgi:glycosyltransferase involved in cell wall biosynthesis